MAGQRAIRNGLRGACEDLRARGLHLASKWTSEQLYSMSSQDATGNGHENNVNTNGSRSQSHSNIDLMSNDDSVNDASDNDNDEDDEYTSADEGTENYIPRATVESQTRKEKDLILLGQSLILNGEYLRCAHMLRKQGDSSSAPHAHTNTMKVRSAHGVFLATYSLYMAGEKLKDQQQVEKEGRENREAALANAANANNVLPGSAANKTKKAETQKVQTKNPFLGDIFKDLWPIYVSTNTHVPGGTEAGTGSDDNGMNAVQPPTSSAEPDAFLLYMLAIIVRDLYSQQGGMLSMKHTIGVLAKAGLANRRNSDGNVNNPSPAAAAAAAAVAVPTAYDLFLSSLRIYPWNWSCWQDLSQLCISSQIPIPVWDDVYKGGGSSREACHWIMYQHFLASFYLEQQNGDAALSSISTLAEWFPSSYTIVTYKALAHYALRDYDRAQECFEAARNVDPHQLAHVDTYSNILYVKERRAELSHLAHVVTKIDKFSAESCCVVGNYYSLKGKHERAITYFQRALRANPKFLPAWTLMGHECVELRNTAAAVQCYRNAVDLSPSDYRAWYGLGQTYEMLHLYQYSLYYYKKAAALKPSDARMWSAVGSQFVRLGAKKDAMRTFERAMNCGDSEGVATRELARLYRDEGRLEDAANCYVGYLQSCGEHHLITAALEMVEDNHRSLGGGGGGKGDIDASYSSKANTSHHSVLSQAAAFTVGGSANGMVQLDPERVEGALFLANYYRSRAELAKAEAFCALLVDFVGPEGDEARAIVRDIRSIAITRYQQRGGGGSGDASNVNANINANVNVSSSSFGIQQQQRQQQQQHGQNLGSFTRTRTPEHRVYNHSTPGTALSGFSGIGSTDSAGAGIYHDTSARPGVAESPGSEYDPDEIAGHLSMSSDGGN